MSYVIPLEVKMKLSDHLMSIEHICSTSYLHKHPFTGTRKKTNDPKPKPKLLGTSCAQGTEAL
jgi:hypothetical protein